MEAEGEHCCDCSHWDAESLEDFDGRAVCKRRSTVRGVKHVYLILMWGDGSCEQFVPREVDQPAAAR